MNIRDFIKWCKFYLSKDLSVIPVKSDKRPWIEWKEYQTRLATLDEVRQWARKFSNDLNIAIVCGRVSNNLVVLDFETESKYREFLDKLSQVDSTLAHILEKNTWIVKTGLKEGGERGVHIYIRLVDSKCLPKTSIRVAPDVDLKSEGGYVVAPPSKHPCGLNYEFTMDPSSTQIVELTCGQFETILEVLKKMRPIEEKRVEEKRSEDKLRCREWKFVPEDRMRKVVELLKKYYIPGYRDLIVFHLLGWFVKRCVAKECAKWIVEKLAIETNDEEIKARLYLVDYHYDKRIDPQYTSHVPIQKLKGKTGLIEVLTKVLVEQFGYSEDVARNEAIDVVRQIEQLMGIVYHRALIAVQVKATTSGAYAWVINDPRRGLVLAKKKVKKELDQDCYVKCMEEENAKASVCRQKCRKEIIDYDYEWLASWYIDKLSIFQDITSGLELFNIRIRYPGSNIVRTLKYVTFDDIIDELKSTGSMFRKLPDYLSMIIYGFVKRGVKTRRGRIVLGFVLGRNDRLKFVRRGKLAYLYKDIDKVSDEHGKLAISTLVELVKKWFNNDLRIWDVLAWAVIAPFGFVRKQKGLRNYILLLTGEPRTGKSTLQNVIETMYNLDNEFGIKSQSTLLSVPRLARAVMHTTFPIAIHEVRSLPLGSEIVASLKNIATETTVHEIASAHKTITKPFPAYSLLSISCNYAVITDPGLEERIYEIKFTTRDRKVGRIVEEFQRWLSENREKLRLFGKWFAKWCVEHWDEIRDIVLQEDMIKAGRDLLNKILQHFGYEPIKFEKTPEEVIEEVKERPTDIDYLIRLILEDYVKIRDRVRECDYVDIADSVICAVEKHYMPSYYKKTYVKNSNGEYEEALAITSMAIYEIANRYNYYTTSLEVLSEKIMGRKPTTVTIGGKVVKALVIPKSKLRELLTSTIT